MDEVLAGKKHTRNLPDIDVSEVGQFSVSQDIGGYFANTALAGTDSFGLHLNLEVPLVANLRLNSDYLSGNNALGATTIKLLYPLMPNWQLGFGVQIPNVYTGDRFIGLLGLYWH